MVLVGVFPFTGGIFEKMDRKLKVRSFDKLQLITVFIQWRIDPDSSKRGKM